MKPFIGLLCVFALASPLLVIATPLLAQPTRPAITGIAFARFYTTDPAGAQKFYGDTLGFERKQVDGMWLYPVNNAQWIECRTTPPPQPNVRMDAVAFTTRDAAGLQHYLQAHGIKPDISLANGQFAVRDPEGNLLVFVQSGSEKPVASAAIPPDATSTRIIHVGFMAHDRDKEDAFWQTILGFRPYWHGGRNADVTDWVALQALNGSDWIEYMLNPAPTPNLSQSGKVRPFLTRRNPYAGRRCRAGAQPLRRRQLQQDPDGARRQSAAQPLRPGQDARRIHGVRPHPAALLFPLHWRTSNRYRR